MEAPIDPIHGKTSGLKAGQQRRLQTLYRRRVAPAELISRELVREMASLSRELNRQVALLLTRKGEVSHVVVGDHSHVWIPELSGYREGSGRLCGLRCIHTHLEKEPLSEEDLSDLVLLALDAMACVEVDERGIAGAITYAHILPHAVNGQGWMTEKVPDIGQLRIDFMAMIQALEDELVREQRGHALDQREKALLVGVTTGPRWKAESHLDELEELARSDGLDVVAKVVQRLREADPRFLIRKGKLGELVLQCLQTGAGLIIFDQELSPAQVDHLTKYTDLKIIDRSQLILDIFARRAVTREGKIQVELAQLKYLLPRLAAKNTAMSRLTGGIGGRGPGETKLEINRRRVRDRIAALNRELSAIKVQRAGRRRLRNARRLPVISIVGYTNAGKSTLLNALTHSAVGARNRLFETLDPSSRRLRFPEEREAIITDTVGFIRDLPQSLMEAFAATLEELQDADLLLHVMDITHPQLEEQAATVERILTDLSLQEVPVLKLLNKADLLEAQEAEDLAEKMGGCAVSALHPPTLAKVVEMIDKLIWPDTPTRNF